MRSQVSQIQEVAGHDAATEATLVNMRFDSTRGWWVNDRGWEAWTSYWPDTNHTDVWLQPIRSAIWFSRSSGEHYLIVEQGSEISWIHGNNGEDVNSTRFVLEQDRRAPGPGEHGCKFVQHSKFVLAIDGRNRPVMLFPDHPQASVPFGFSSIPDAPRPMGVNPDLLNGLISAGTGTGAQDETCAVGLLGLNPPLLGDYTEDASNSYEWRISYVSLTGSESPLSSPGFASWTNGSAPAASTFAVPLALPSKLPDNARKVRIYRTKNMGDNTGAQDRTYYFVAEVEAGTRMWMDTVSDTRLTIAAPDTSGVRVLPPGCSSAAAYDGRLWLGGGAHSPTRVWYSEPGLPEQFGPFSFLDFGGSGGSVTEICSHGGLLYVFRQRSIEVVRTTEQLLYSASTVSGVVGCTSPKTIVDVPGLGLVFLSGSDLYALSDGALSRISAAVADELSRISGGERALAAYAHKDRELVVVFPADGSVECTRAVVYHTDAKRWSVRYAPIGAGEQLHRWSFTALAVDSGGRLLAAAAPMSPNLTSVYPGQLSLTDLSIGDQIEGVGWWVWSAAPYGGARHTVASVVTVGDAAGFTVTDATAAKVESQWRSAWHEFDAMTQVLSVEAWMVNAADVPLTLEYAVDGRDEWFDGPACEVAQYETWRTSSADHVYADDADAVRYGYSAKWGSSKWREDRLVRVRWDISLQRRSCQSVSVRLKSDEHFGLAQYRVFIASSTKNTGTTKR